MLENSCFVVDNVLAVFDDNDQDDACFIYLRNILNFFSFEIASNWKFSGIVPRVLRLLRTEVKANLSQDISESHSFPTKKQIRHNTKNIFSRQFRKT